MSPQYLEEPYTAACPKCGTSHTLSSKPWQSGPRKDKTGAPCHIYYVGATRMPRRIDVYCASCWVEIGAPRTGDTRTCVLCGRVGTGQFRFELHPDTRAPEWRCAHTEKCLERAYPAHGWNGPDPTCRFVRSGIHDPDTAPATHTASVPGEGCWSMVCEGCADYIRQHDTRSGVEVQHYSGAKQEGPT